MKTKNRFYRIGACILLCLVFTEVWAAKDPKGLSTDFRMRQIMYDANDIVRISGSYGYQTSIEFGVDEEIKLVTLGDSAAWQAVPYINRLFIKPVEDQANTNMTVVTNKHTYFFQLDTSDKRSAQTFLIRFVYPNTRPISSVMSSEIGTNSRIEHLNWDYSTSGDKTALAVRKIFDDSTFTYFLFEENSEIPAIYIVDEEGHESIVNTRREGKYFVVERVGARFTLRNGKSYLCVRNNHVLKQFVSSEQR